LQQYELELISEGGRTVAKVGQKRDASSEIANSSLDIPTVRATLHAQFQSAIEVLSWDSINFFGVACSKMKKMKKVAKTNYLSRFILLKWLPDIQLYCGRDYSRSHTRKIRHTHSHLHTYTYSISVAMDTNFDGEPSQEIPVNFESSSTSLNLSGWQM
jgi:hypothetical protein